ncbi:hypothetical protein Ahy_B04g070548 isoform E [Arachis hypogaea]|uniref:FAR1 domain-containing protein n=1 Tax=Arachis hypogaea TaxID=3818 RepID=A0A444ZHU8_ARAHY|nr:hypothetical protein Ahy_B04g070548 isoform E [Arachis hypogaea]
MVEDIWNLEFRIEDEACQFYNAYACWHGFVMRKDDIVKDKESKIICRQLVCNKEGWRNMRYLDLDNRSREARSLMRNKCPARLKVKVDYDCGRWKVSCFVESHNHDLMPPNLCISFRPIVVSLLLIKSKWRIFIILVSRRAILWIYCILEGWISSCWLHTQKICTTTFIIIVDQK